MNKFELVSGVASASGLTKTDSEKAVDALFDVVTQALKQGDEVRLVGFGTFSVSTRAETEGRNPRTGAKIVIPERKIPKFRPGKTLKDAVFG